ncbi:MAG TPA: hypothetical protein VGN07_07820 [Steroidobacteraceae bacterium]|jgi:hypothetical protein
MKSWLVESHIAAIAVMLTCCLLVWQRFTTDRWKQRFGAIGSALIKPPTYRALFVLVLIGVLLISVLPEAALLLPAFDAVGLDVVTILVSLELRHYVASVARLVGIPTNVAGYRRVLTQLVRHCRDVILTKPVLWPYKCMWIVMWIKMLSGTMRASPSAQI